MKKKIIIGVTIGLIIIGIILSMQPTPPIVDANNDNNDLGFNDGNKNIVVEIKGEVAVPGLYILKEGSRINDLIILSGGLTNSADTSNINLAEMLEDGEVISVNAKVENIEQNTKISINTAKIEELTTLEGIGEAKARSIIEYRNQIGGFKSIEELVNVNGISENIYNKVKEFICL